MTGILLSVGLMFVSVSVLAGSMANQLKFKALEEKIKLLRERVKSIEKDIAIPEIHSDGGRLDA